MSKFRLKNDFIIIFLEPQSLAPYRELWSEQLVSIRHVPEVLFPYTERLLCLVDHPIHDVPYVDIIFAQF